MQRVPEDFNELFEEYQDVIEAAGAPDAMTMAYRVYDEGFLSVAAQRGGPFEVFLTKTVVSLLGDWSCEPSVVPENFDDFYETYGGVLETAGASEPLHMAYLIFDRGLLKGAPQHRASFERFLAEKVEELLLEKKASTFEYPDTLPKDNTEMYNSYRPLVSSSFRRVIRWGFDPKDAEQEVWMKLTQNNVPQKYFQQAILLRLPGTLTGEEAREYLGLNEGQWEDAAQGLMPVEGDCLDEEATFKKSDITALDDSGTLPESRPYPRRLPAEAIKAKNFETYLRTAAHRLACNMIRTRERRFAKDDPMKNPNVFLAKGSTSYHVSYADPESKESWESSLADQSVSAEQLTDAHMLATELELNGEEELVDKLRGYVKEANKAGYNIDLTGKTDNSEEALEFIRHLAQGWTRQEAQTFMTRMKRRTTIQAQMA